MALFNLSIVWGILFFILKSPFLEGIDSYKSKIESQREKLENFFISAISDFLSLKSIETKFDVDKIDSKYNAPFKNFAFKNAPIKKRTFSSNQYSILNSYL